MIKQLTIGAVLCITMVVASVQAIVIGSNTAPSRQAQITFPAADSDNEMRGFAAFETGFLLQTAAARCIYNSFFPVGTLANLNGGTLTLQKDLELSTALAITHGGTIQGGGFKLRLPVSASSINFPVQTTYPFIFNNCTIELRSPVVCSVAMTFSGFCTIKGNGNTLDISSTNTFSLASGATLTLEDTTLKGLSGSKLACVDSTGKLVVKNSTFIQTGNYSYTKGLLEIRSEVMVTGGYVFTYASDQSLTIKSGAKFFFDSGSTFKYDPNGGSKTLLVMEDQSATIHFYESTLQATALGLSVTKGTLIWEGSCPVVSNATLSANGIIWGDGISTTNDVLIKVLPESGPVIQSGFVRYKNMGS